LDGSHVHEQTSIVNNGRDLSESRRSVAFQIANSCAARLLATL
jgi:hypothetical protein